MGTVLRLICARVCTDLYETFLIGLYYLMTLSFKFYKDPSFGYIDICITSSFNSKQFAVWDNLYEHKTNNKV